MKSIFIHAGPGKTGTSAIQHWMSNHVDYLADNGIHYPSHDVDINGISPGNYDAVLSQNDNGVWCVDKNKVEILLTQFENSVSHTLVLSSEILIGQIEDLLALMPSARVILYFRNPLELMESNYNQLIKRHRHTNKFKANRSKVLMTIKRFTQLLEKYGSETIFIKPYYKDESSSFNILHDILETIAPNLSITSKPSRINPSYCFESLELKRLLNHYPIGDMEHECDLALQSLQLDTEMYSLINAKEYSELKSLLLRELDMFLQHHNQKKLKSMVASIKATENQTYREQALNKQELTNIWVALNSHNADLCIKLLTCVANNRDIETGNKYLYEAAVDLQAKLNTECDVKPDELPSDLN